MKLTARNIAKYAVLTAAALAISVLESWLPSAFVPIPGVKLGLSNTVTLFILYVSGIAPASVILIARCFLASLFGGGITSFAFSVCGGICALLTMCLMMRFKAFSIFGVSIAGASAHGIGQIFVAAVMFSSFSAVFYLPFLLLSAVFTGAITAFIASVSINRLKNYV